MEKKDAILIVDGEQGSLYQEIKNLPGKLETQQTQYPQLRKVLSQVSPHVVIFNINQMQDGVKELLSTLQAQHPDTVWVLSGHNVNSEELLDYMRHGAHDFLRQPIQENEFTEFLNRLDKWNQAKAGNGGTDNNKIISLFSCKGGVGQSFAGVNLALALKQKEEKKILIADYVLQHGNIATLLDLPTKYTITDLSENLERVDAKLLENSLPKHKSGIFTLPCPNDPEEADRVAEASQEDILKLMRGIFDYTIIDAGHEFNAATVSCLDVSDYIYLITTPDLTSLANTRTALETFRRLEYGEDKVKLILNRWKMRGEIDTATIEKSLNYKIFHKIIDDPKLSIDSINQGIPLHELNKKAKITKCFDQLAELLPASQTSEA